MVEDKTELVHPVFSQVCAWVVAGEEESWLAQGWVGREAGNVGIMPVDVGVESKDSEDNGVA
ncbi:hypothetical protein [Trueperella sp. LYQ143]|uniref:hypothetical protein n=1 Tax=Trueperella sp. LYQ143 TaxID=3391059 RepID=UPI003983AB0D